MDDDLTGGKPIGESGISGDDPACVTVTMTRGQHRAIKGRARELGTSVSELVRMWVAGESRQSKVQ